MLPRSAVSPGETTCPRVDQSFIRSRAGIGGWDPGEPTGSTGWNGSS